MFQPTSCKRARASTNAQSTAAVDEHKFRSLAHQQRFHIIAKRNLQREKGFDLTAGKFPMIENYIAANNWSKLCIPGQRSYPALVKEFYANAYTQGDEEVSYTSHVRGVEVRYDAESIARCFGLEYDQVGDSYNCNMRERHDGGFLNEVASALCRTGATWVVDRAGQPNKLKSIDLQPVAKAWHTFVQHNLLPTGNALEITISQAILIYTILSQGDVHIGYLIGNNIHRVVHENAHGPLPYPSLISKLCAQAGVDTAGEESFSALKAIDDLDMEKYRTEHEVVISRLIAMEPPRPSNPPPQCASFQSMPSNYAHCFDRLNQLLNALQSRPFDRLDQLLNALQSRPFDRLNQLLHALWSSRPADYTQRFDRLDQHTQRFDRLDQLLHAQQQLLLNNHQILMDHIQTLQKNQDLILSCLYGLTMQVPLLWACQFPPPDHASDD